MTHEHDRAHAALRAYLDDWLATQHTNDLDALLRAARADAMQVVRDILRDDMVPLLMQQLTQRLANQHEAPTTERLPPWLRQREAEWDAVSAAIAAEAESNPSLTTDELRAIAAEVANLTGTPQYAADTHPSDLPADPAHPAAPVPPDTANGSGAALAAEIAALQAQLAHNEQELAELSVPADPASITQPDASATPDAPATPATPDTSATSATLDAPGTPATPATGYYVYAVVWGSADLPPLPTISIDGATPVLTTAVDDLRVIYSAVPLAEFGQDVIEDNMQDPDWLEAKVLLHQHILDELLALDALVPFKFGTIYRSRERMRDMLTEYATGLRETLAFVAQRKEWGVKLWASRTVLREIALAHDDEVRAAQATLDAKGGGAAYMMQKRMERLLDEGIERQRKEIAHIWNTEIERWAVVSDDTLTQSQQAGEHKDDILIASYVYLVADAELATFRDTLATLRTRFPGVRYDLTGPWVPYHFVRLGARATAGGEADHA